MTPGAPPLRLLRTSIDEALPDVPADVIADIEVVATELVTNAFLHGDLPVEFHLRPGARDGVVRIEVFDGGALMPMVRHPDVRTFNGRGMLLVEAFSERWGVTIKDRGKTVWAEVATG